MQHCGRRNVSHGFHSWPGFWERYLRETGRQARQQKRRGWAGCVVTHVLQSKQACWLCGQGIQSRERRNGGKVLGVRGRVRACCGATRRAAHKAATRRRTPKFIGYQSCPLFCGRGFPAPRTRQKLPSPKMKALESNVHKIMFIKSWRKELAAR